MTGLNKLGFFIAKFKVENVKKKKIASSKRIKIKKVGHSCGLAAISMFGCEHYYHTTEIGLIEFILVLVTFTNFTFLVYSKNKRDYMFLFYGGMLLTI